MLLSNIRVIDATSRWGELAGRMLAELGAEVIKIESAEGCEARRLPPFDHRDDRDHSDLGNLSDRGVRGESLYWAALGAGKRSLVADDPVAFLEDADVFIESGYTEGLAARFPHLLHVSVTPFGAFGPRAHAPATELTVEAAGGIVGLQGDGDRPPVPMGVMPQAAFHAGAQAAADIVVALTERLTSGRGQHLDVSAQACIVWTLMHATGFPPNVGTNPPGTSEFRAEEHVLIAPGLRMPFIERCRDGLVQIRFVPAVIGERTYDAMMRWVEDANLDAVPEHLRGRDFTKWIRDFRAGDLSVDDVQACSDLVVALIATQTKAQLLSYAVEHALTIAPIYTVEDLIHDPHLEARGYWIEIDGRTHPGRFAKFSGTPLVEVRGAPSIGDLTTLQPRSVPAAVPSVEVSENHGPFHGLKVADFSWVGVGPMIGKAFADHGATVVRIESHGRPDLLRTLGPYKDNVPGPNRTQFPANFNSSKLGITLDLKNEGGLALARSMADWADVVLESFSPGTMTRFGLDYENLSADRDDLIMLSTCLRGQTGPERAYSGFGGQGAAIAGLFGLVGWPDRLPTGPWGAYTDFITPRFGITALAAAIYHRRLTGKGQYIDVSQIEAGIRFIEPLILDYCANGTIAERLGQGSKIACPHGVYGAHGKERYVALAVEDETQWDALATMLDLPCAFAERFQHEAEIDRSIGAWFENKDAFAAAETARRNGVPAYVAMRPTDLYEDPQLAYREFFVTLDHPEMGPTPYDGPATIYSRTPQRLRSPAPMVGEHNDRVLGEILGLSPAEIESFRSAGALG
ncbi:MAG: CoA transferase [Gammaproteobacteria bacterium]|nr:CoA transferase [Gammaproteobacteria bacterium]